jgi:hypothetical protein
MRNNAITRAMAALEREIDKLNENGGATNNAAADELSRAFDALAILDREGR